MHVQGNVARGSDANTPSSEPYPRQSKAFEERIREAQRVLEATR